MDRSPTLTLRYQRLSSPALLTDEAACRVAEYAFDHPRASHVLHRCACGHCRSISLGGARDSARFVYQLNKQGITALAVFESDHSCKTKVKATRYQLCLYKHALSGDFDRVPTSSTTLFRDLLLDDASWTPAGREALRLQAGARRAR